MSTARESAGPTESPPAFDDLRRAAEWFALLQSDHPGDGDRQDWLCWLESGPGARAAWQRVESLASGFSDLSRLPARAALEGKARMARGRRDVLRALALLPVAGLAGWLVEGRTSWRAWTAAYRTGVGERREIMLADGGRFWLNTGSAADVHYSPRLRRLVLHAGELLLTSAHDMASRPLVVDVPQGRLQAMGTRFAVRHAAGDTVLLTVFEGAVLARTVSGGTQLVEAGRAARVWPDRVERIGPATPQADAWTRGVLVADNMRLGDFLAELGRYRRGVLLCSDAVADLRIVGAYPVADTDQVLDALQSTLPVRLHRPLPWWVMVGAAGETAAPDASA